MNNPAFREVVADLIKAATGKPPTPARKRLSLEEIAYEISPEIDREILSRERAGESFAFGKFRIIALKNLDFITNYELYFENVTTGKYVMVAREQPPRNSWIWLSNAAWLELKYTHEKVFDIEAPAKE